VVSSYNDVKMTFGWFSLVLWCSTIFQLYRGCQFY